MPKSNEKLGGRASERCDSVQSGNISSDERPVDQLCHHHQDRIAERRCQACRKPLCGECVMREQTGFDVCSFACADRLTRFAQERKEAEKLDPWPIRIFVFIFRLVVLTIVVAFGVIWSLFVVLGSLAFMVTDNKPRSGT